MLSVIFDDFTTSIFDTHVEYRSAIATSLASPKHLRGTDYRTSHTRTVHTVSPHAASRLDASF